jgi:cbb3-type cytochrome oxidase subunit 3
MELILMLILFLAAWFWLDSMGKRERAILLGGELAARYNLQLLDESVACTKLSLGRNRRGHVQFLRRYVFDVSARGVDRLHCELILLGDQLQTWHIPPYQQ